MRALNPPIDTRVNTNQQTIAARLGEDRLMVWNSAPNVVGEATIRAALARITGSSTEMIDVPSPFEDDRAGVVLLEAPASVIAVAMPSAAHPNFTWASWRGDEFDEPRLLDFDPEDSADIAGLMACEGRAAMVYLVYREEGITGVGVVEWLGGEEPTLWEVAYPGGALGPPPGRDLDALSPEIRGCVADATGVLNILVRPGGRPAPAVLVRFGTTTFADPVAVPVGTQVSNGFLHAPVTGPARIFVLRGDEIALYQAGATPRELGARSHDIVSGSGGDPSIVSIDDGELLLLGGWALTWSDETSSFSAPVRISDVPCRTRDRFRESGGVLRMVAACTPGAGFTNLMQFEICGPGDGT